LAQRGVLRAAVPHTTKAQTSFFISCQIQKRSPLTGTAQNFLNH
jgi:hypothetical protein